MATQAPIRRRRGAPSIPYDPEIAEDICTEIVIRTDALGTILAGDNRYPSLSVVTKWLNSNAEFAMMYARAKELQADNIGEHIIEIADGEGQAHDKRIRIDARRWLMSKLNPRRYGDKLDVTTAGQPITSHNSVTIDARVQSIMLLADQRRLALSLLDE